MAHKRFYIDLDFIFDTRISLLHRLDPDYIKREFDIEKYRNRTNDWFATPTTKFTEAEWLEAWANRDVEILQNSIVTNGVKTLHETIASIDWGIDPSDSTRKVSVAVNCWPYKGLGDAAKAEICKCIAGLCPITIDVTTCFIPPNYLFLADAKQNYELMFHYNPFEWLEYHKEELERIDMPELWVVSPALLRGKEDEVKDNPLLESFDPFALVEMACANKFTLRFIPTSDVCLLRPKA